MQGRAEQGQQLHAASLTFLPSQRLPDPVDQLHGLGQRQRRLQPDRMRSSSARHRITSPPAACLRSGRRQRSVSRAALQACLLNIIIMLLIVILMVGLVVSIGVGIGACCASCICCSTPCSSWATLHWATLHWATLRWATLRSSCRLLLRWRSLH